MKDELLNAFAKMPSAFGEGALLSRAPGVRSARGMWGNAAGLVGKFVGRGGV